MNDTAFKIAHVIYCIQNNTSPFKQQHSQIQQSLKAVVSNTVAYGILNAKTQYLCQSQIQIYHHSKMRDVFFLYEP